MVEPWPEEFVGGLTTKKYISITRSSPATAKRDIQELIEKKNLIPNPAKGRSASYRLNNVK
jgi:Fic family protein